MNGFGEGIKTSMKNQKLGMAMMKAKRMSPSEMFGGHGIKDPAGFKKMVDKAHALEAARISGEEA
jgi:quinone-modifying oxidoreductase subunit QmoC